METAALCKPIQRFADLLRIPARGFSQGLENSSLRSAVSHSSHRLYDYFTHIFIGGFLNANRSKLH